MIDFQVNDDLCNRCRECVRDCPARIIEQEGTALPFITEDNEPKCLRCHHCLAVCPTAAVSILGKVPDESLSLEPGTLPDLDAMERLVRGRRSVRRFRKADVDPALITRLLAGASHAPTGANQRALSFIVIDKKDKLRALRKQVMDALRTADEEGRIPEHFAYLKTAIPAFFTYGGDLIFRGAPHLLIVAAGPGALCPCEDATIALSTFEMLAASAGLGTVWCGMLKMALESVPELKAVFGIPEDATHYYAMLFGIPSVKYARTVQRDDSATVKRLG